MKLLGVKKQRSRNAQIVGDNLAAVLPETKLPFWRVWHLLRLNIILLVPMFSAGTGGYDGALMNALQIAPYWKAYFGHPVKAQLGFINAIYPVGKICGLAIITPISDRFWRRLALLLAFIVCVIGAGIQAGSVNLSMLLFSRWLLGVGTAFMAQPSPIIIAELAYPTHRGKLTALFNTFYFFGAISAAWLTYGTIKIDSDWSWRIPSLLQGAFPLVQLIFWFAIPQSPRWLISKGRVDEARSIFVHHHAGGYVGSPLVDFEIAEIQETLRLEQEHEAGSWKDMIKTPANRRRCLIAVVLGSSAQWVGNAVVTYYLVLVLNDIGITNPTNQALINGGLQIFNLLASIFCGALLVDRLGRRTLFLWSAVGMGISYVVWTALNSQFIATKSAAVGTAVIPMLFIFFFHYDIAFTPLLYAYPTEIFPYALRGAGVSLTYFTSHVGLIAGQFVNPVAMAAISWKYYIVFCVTNALLVVFVWFFLPETKGYSLEEVAIAFVDEAAVRNAIPVFLKKDEMEASRIHIEEAA